MKKAIKRYRYACIDSSISIRIARIFALAVVSIFCVGCNTTSFERILPDGSTVSVSNSRVFWSTESYEATMTETGATLKAEKSREDAQAIKAAAEGVARGLASAK